MNKKAKILLEYVAKTTGQIVEVGSLRNFNEDDDGYSSYYLAKFAKENNRKFISCEINHKNIETTKQVLQKHNLSACLLEGDGKTILSTLGEIGFLYLDSHRLPIFSFEQYKAAALLKNSIVIIDDAQKYDTFQYGKATFLIQLFDKINIKYEIVETHSKYKMVIAHVNNGKKSGELQ